MKGEGGMCGLWFFLSNDMASSPSRRVGEGWIRLTGTFLELQI